MRKTADLAKGVTITAGLAGVRVHLDGLPKSSEAESVCGGTARAPGGAQATVTSPRLDQTIALSDGTRIVFVAAETPQEIESAALPAAGPRPSG